MFVERSTLVNIEGAVFGVLAAVVATGTFVVLSQLGVTPAQIWELESAPVKRSTHTMAFFAVGLIAGALLGSLGQIYWETLREVPSLTSISSTLATHAALPLSIVAIVVAPLPCEYLFRGLLFRTLSQEWGSARAAVASAVLSSLYHPIEAWLPMICLGIACACIFKKSGSLTSAVALHTAYNALFYLGM